LRLGAAFPGNFQKGFVERIPGRAVAGCRQAPGPSTPQDRSRANDSASLGMTTMGRTSLSTFFPTCHPERSSRRTSCLFAARSGVPGNFQEGFVARIPGRAVAGCRPARGPSTPQDRSQANDSAPLGMTTMGRTWLSTFFPTCHPERSRAIRNANHSTQSKDLMLVCGEKRRSREFSERLRGENSWPGRCWLPARTGSLDSTRSFASERFCAARDDNYGAHIAVRR
jgi:hypothetical protein